MCSDDVTRCFAGYVEKSVICSSVINKRKPGKVESYLEFANYLVIIDQSKGQIVIQLPFTSFENTKYQPVPM
jgi:hypothetical protein